MISFLLLRERQGGIGAVNTGTARIDQMINVVMTATLQNIEKAVHVIPDIRVGILNRVTHTRLRCQMNNSLNIKLIEETFNFFTIDNVQFYESKFSKDFMSSNLARFKFTS